MAYEVNGKTVQAPIGECGIYKRDTLDMQYAVMAPELVIDQINRLSVEKAIAATTALRDMANEQAQWEKVPPIIGDPILTGGPGPTPIDKVRDNIKNTARFTETILEALAA